MIASIVIVFVIFAGISAMIIYWPVPIYDGEKNGMFETERTPESLSNSAAYHREQLEAIRSELCEHFGFDPMEDDPIVDLIHQHVYHTNNQSFMELEQKIDRAWNEC